jgi:hypothetical protein
MDMLREEFILPEDKLRFPRRGTSKDTKRKGKEHSGKKITTVMGGISSERDECEASQRDPDVKETRS